ncbi:MAG TPA: hypothetical protein PLY23_09345 [Alphaproteobacteria bacterium]|nr:hypothetical protein [Alphaproteobacteria bacterium]HQS94810.1 hypothetical protein [Alphaproteobacteria bacterium]
MKSSSSYLWSVLRLFIIRVVFSGALLSHSTEAMDGVEEEGKKPLLSAQASAVPSEDKELLLSAVKATLEPYNFSLKAALKEAQDLFRAHLDPKKHLYDCKDIFYTPEGRSAIKKVKDALDFYFFMFGLDLSTFSLRGYSEFPIKEIERFLSLPKMVDLSFDEEGKNEFSEICKKMIMTAYQI